MAVVHGEAVVELSRIAGEFPGWRPWVSDAGGRQPARPPEWWAMTVDADDPDGLRKAIAEQDRLADLIGAA